MSRILPTPVLAVAATAALLTDLSVAGSASFADAAEDVATALPIELPADAFIARASGESAELDGLSVAAHLNDAGQYEVVVANHADSARDLHLELTVSHLSGSPMDRMPAFPIQVHAEQVKLAIPAGSQVSQTLAYAVPRAEPIAEPQGIDEALMGRFSFDQIGVQLLDLPADQPPTATTLRLSSATAAL